MSDSELDSPSMEVESPRAPPIQPSQRGHQQLQLNTVSTYNLAGQSELKCHFRLRKIYMPRQERIEQFTQRIVKYLGLESKVAYMQLSNVYRDEGLVDYCFGMYFDEDAFSIVRENVVFRLETKDKLIVLVKPQPMEVFQRMLDKNPVKVSAEEKYLPPLGHPQPQQKEEQKRPIEERFEQAATDKSKFDNPPKGLYRLMMVCFPEGMSQQQLQKSVKSHPKGGAELQFCRWRGDLDVPSYEVLVNEWTYHILLEDGIENGFYSLIILEQRDPPVMLLRSLYRFQLKVTSSRNMNLLSIYNFFRRSRLAYVLELTQPNQFLLVFTKEPSLADMQRSCTGFILQPLKESQALNPRLIKTTDRFYELTRKKRQPPSQ